MEMEMDSKVCIIQDFFKVLVLENNPIVSNVLFSNI